MLSSKVREHLGRIAEIKIDLITLGVFLRTIGQGVVNCLDLDVMTRICGDDSVLIRSFQSMIRTCFSHMDLPCVAPYAL